MTNPDPFRTYLDEVRQKLRLDGRLPRADRVMRGAHSVGDLMRDFVRALHARCALPRV